MAVYDISYEGVRDSGTFTLNATTKSTIEANPEQIVGKVVTITGNGEVGYGEDTNVPLGVVSAVEPYKSGDKTMVVTVDWHRCFENIPCTSGDAAGDYLLCDGKGGLKTTSTPSPCKAIAVTEQLATIKID